MPRAKGSEKLLICILHNHNGEHGTTIGVIDVGPTKKNEGIAKKHINSWVKKKFEEHQCKRYGDRCGVDVRPAGSGLKTAILLTSAEPIVPVQKKSKASPSSK